MRLVSEERVDEENPRVPKKSIVDVILEERELAQIRKAKELESMNDKKEQMDALQQTGGSLGLRTDSKRE